MLTAAPPYRFGKFAKLVTMYQFDPVTGVQLAHLREARLDSRLAMLRLVSDAGVTETSLPIRLLNRVGNYLSHLDSRSRAA